MQIDKTSWKKKLNYLTTVEIVQDVMNERRKQRISAAVFYCTFIKSKG